MITVVIPSRNVDNLRACVRALRAAEPNVRIVWIDDQARACSNYSDRQAIAELYRAGVTIVAGTKPFVFARNVNIGIVAAPADSDIVILNDDALIETPGGLTVMQTVARVSPAYGLISAACNNVGNANQHKQGQGLREDPQMVCFVCTLIPRRTIALVGLLDEEFTGYGYDDNSYCLRTRRAGLKIGIFDGCVVDHSTLPSTYRSGEYPAEAFRHNRDVFEAKYGPGSLSL